MTVSRPFAAIFLIPLSKAIGGGTLVINGDLSVPHGGEWWIEVNDGNLQDGHGQSPIQMSLSSYDKDCVAFASHDQLSAPGPIYTGRLKVRGDHGYQKTREMFP